MTEPTTAAERLLDRLLDDTIVHNYDDKVREIDAALVEAEKKATEGEGTDWHYCDFDSPHHVEARQQDASALRLLRDALLDDHDHSATYIAESFKEAAILAADPPSAPAGLDVPGWVFARAARSIHVSGEGDECDGSEALWCDACWQEARDWLDPNTTSPGLLEVDAEYARLEQDHP